MHSLLHVGCSLLGVLIQFWPHTPLLMSGKRSPSPAEEDLISPGQPPGMSGPGVKRDPPRERKDTGKPSKRSRREDESLRDSSSVLDLRGDGSESSTSTLSNAPPIVITFRYFPPRGFSCSSSRGSRWLGVPKNPIKSLLFALR